MCVQFTGWSTMEPVSHTDMDKFRDFQKNDFEADWVKMAEGSFGQIYKVKMKVWREMCAVKCFSASFDGISVYRRMMKESAQLEKVKFSYIVSIYGLCNNPPAMVMEYMSNGSLDALLHSHVLMWPKKFQMVHEVTMGMNYLHSMMPALLHLNLKPTNILLDNHLHVKISDFGLVKWEEFSSSMEFVNHLSARGNISYIPPEIFSQSPEAPGTKYDVYSFAIVMWEILAQKKPYPGSTNMTAVIMKVSGGKRPSVELIQDDRPQECEDIIEIMQCCWRQEPAQRPPFLEIVRETESLSEVLKIPDVVRACGEKQRRHKQANPKLSAYLQQDLRRETQAASGRDDRHGDIMALLSRGDVQELEAAVKQQHVSAAYAGQNTLLHYAAASQQVGSVGVLLELGAPVDVQNSMGYTPLTIATLHRAHDICSLLMGHQANVNTADSDGWTALHFAAQSGDDRTARMLLDHSAAPSPQEKDGWTPLHLAAQNGHEAVVRTLLPRMPAVEQLTAGGLTALHLASRYGHLGIVQLLLKQGANLNLTGGAEGSALHLASEEGHFRVARLLISNGADINLMDSHSYSALHWAALKGHAGICRMLLGKGACADTTTSQGWMPIHLAALKGHPAPILLLVEHRASVDARGPGGWTALHLACHHGQEEVVSVLLSTGADSSLADEQGWTPLHLACNSGSFPSVLQLIFHHAQVNVQNARQATPLHLATASGNAPIVQALLLHGAQKTVVDANGYTAQDLAKRNQKKEVMELLGD